MNISWKKTILIVLAIVVIITIILFSYLCLELSGNPFIMRQRKRDIVNIYEDRYEKDFIVIDSRYNYKRKEYIVELAPRENPEHKFSTTLGETRRTDYYGQLQAIMYISDKISYSIGEEYSEYDYSYYVIEEYDSQNVMETVERQPFFRQNYSEQEYTF